MNEIETLVKLKAGITGTALDSRVAALTAETISELETVYKIKPPGTSGGSVNMAKLSVISDLVVWRLDNHDGGQIPRHIQIRLHDLSIIGEG